MSNIVDVKFNKSQQQNYQLREGVVRVGFFSGQQYESGKTVASVARYNEFGLGVPARPFIRPAVHGKKEELVDLLHRQFREALRNNENTIDVLDRFGEYVKGLVQQQIINTNSPANSPATIKRKGFNAPLKDTLVMLNSVRFETEEVFK